MLSSNKFFNEVRQVIPSGNAVYAEDGAGYAAWMLNGDLKVIDGDGLVNSFEYLKNTRRTCDMKSYFRENNIKYYLLDSSGGDACPVCMLLPEGGSIPPADRLKQFEKICQLSYFRDDTGSIPEQLGKN